jgi:hypothetical protein
MLKSDNSFVSALAGCEELRQVRRISIDWCEGDLVPVFGVTQLTDVRELALAEKDYAGLDARESAALLRAPWLPQLEVLDVGPMVTWDQLVKVVAATRGHLRELHAGLRERDEDDDDFARTDDLAHCALGDLEVLDLANRSITAKGAKELAESPYLERLRALRLSGNTIGKTGATAIGRAFKNLRVLDLSAIPLDVNGWRALAKCSLGKLRDLRLAQTTRMGDDSLRVLAESPLLERVRSLDVRDNAITDAGLEVLASTEACRNLVALDLRRNKGITPRGLAALAASPHFERCTIAKTRPRKP